MQSRGPLTLSGWLRFTKLRNQFPVLLHGLPCNSQSLFVSLALGCGACDGGGLAPETLCGSGFWGAAAVRFDVAFAACFEAPAPILGRQFKQ